jgi:glutathionyl-hydroquinone reductase
MPDGTRTASPVDLATYGEYRYTKADGDQRPLYRFAGRICTDGSTEFPAEAGRYHLYAGWFCPWSQRATIQRQLNGLSDVVSVSYVDNARDGRGWAFRDTYGPDPVNGFALLREAFEATEPGFDGHVSVPVLWDRVTGRIVSNDYGTIDIDLATQFGAWGADADTYPVELRETIDDLDAWLGPVVNQGIGPAGGTGPQAEAARVRLSAVFADLDARLSDRRYLLGDRITHADVRLWVSLVRFGAESDVSTTSAALPNYPHLWAYARDLYHQPAFHNTTDFAAFTGSGVVPPDWSANEDRSVLADVRSQ